MARRQLLALGYGRQAIEHRIATGRLRPVLRGVYAVGRPRLTQHGRWMAAVLSCGPDAVLRRAGVSPPLTRRYLNGHGVDFYWPDLDLVVETDGLRYHRTPAQQARGRIRDQVHAAAGLTTLRFTRAQVRLDPEHVIATLSAVVRRLQSTS